MTSAMRGCYAAPRPPNGDQRHSPACPPTAHAPAIGLLLTQFKQPFERDFLGKGLPPGTRIEDVSIGGSRGVWLDGPPPLFFRQSATRVTDAAPRLAGNTLVWIRDGLTLRIESDLPREAAVRIAASVGGTE